MTVERGHIITDSSELLLDARVLVCGGRDYRDAPRVAFVLRSLRPSLIAHGGARGADLLARDWATGDGVPQCAYPADWEKYGRAAGPRRNADMLAHFKPDLVVAFPGGRGTADMVERALAAGVNVVKVEP